MNTTIHYNNAVSGRNKPTYLVLAAIFFFFIHNDKPKNTNSAVIHKQALYHNTTISLV